MTSRTSPKTIHTKQTPIIVAGVCGGIIGASMVATLDLLLTQGIPLIGSFLPTFFYLGGAVAIAALAVAIIGRWPRLLKVWVALTMLFLVVGSTSALTMAWTQPDWESKIGWRSCRLIADSWYIRSPYPVDIPDCGALYMCDGESGYAMRGLLEERGCAP